MSVPAKGRFDAAVVRNTEASPTTRVIVLERPKRFGEARPGQFVSIRAGGGALLRRPFSIMDLTEKTLTLLVKVVGPGSASIAATGPGETIDLVGPLGGSAFPEPAGQGALFVAGGTGLAPLLFAARAWRRAGILGPACLLYGAGTKDELLRGLVRRAFPSCSFATIDGSAGFRGDVVALARDLARTSRIPRGTLYSCGPRGMVRALARALGGRVDRHYTSLETVMACGVGACRGCTVPLRAAGGTALKTVCGDGTVFRAEEIAWEEWEE